MEMRVRFFRFVFQGSVRVAFVATLCVVMLLSFSIGFAEEVEKVGEKTTQEFNLIYSPLNIPVQVQGVRVKAEHVTRKGSFKAFGKAIKVRQKKGVWSYRIGTGENVTFEKFPEKITFDHRKVTYCVMVYQDSCGNLCYAPHCGVTIHIDGEEIAIVDVNMNRSLGDRKMDGICADRSATLTPYRGEIWTETWGYKVDISGKFPKFLVTLTSLPFPKKGDDSQVNEAWATYNSWRQRGGSNSVLWNETLAKHCKIHAIYCNKAGKLTHPEDPSNPNYTKEGHKSGMNSNLSMGHGDFRSSILVLYQSAYHAASQLSPCILESGFGGAGEFFGIDVRGCRSSKFPRPVELVWPAHGMQDVWVSFASGGESPMPLYSSNDPSTRIGMVVFAVVHGKGPYNLQVVDEEGNIVKGELTTPDKGNSAIPRNGNLVNLSPDEDLQLGTWYTATLTMGKNPKVFKYSWTFQTFGAGEDDFIED